jgi:hypothetical protein
MKFFTELNLASRQALSLDGIRASLDERIDWRALLATSGKSRPEQVVNGL